MITFERISIAKHHNDIPTVVIGNIFLNKHVTILFNNFSLAFFSVGVIEKNDNVTASYINYRMKLEWHIGGSICIPSSHKYRHQNLCLK